MALRSESIPGEADLTRFFRPRGVAIVGASANPDRISGRPLRFFQRHGYRGGLYPVNPGRTEIGGLRCYRSVAELPAPVDLAVIAVDGNQVLAAVEACAQRGIGYAVVFGAGFAEAGPEGVRLQQQLLEIVRRTGIRVSGPNCIGSANLHDGVCPTFAICLDRDAEPGPIAFVTQSGAFGSAIFAQSLDEGTGLGYFVSTGNEVDLTFTDYVGHLLRQENVRVVAGYLEGIRHGPPFLAVADQALAAGKPLVLLKVGRSAVGRKTAASHTGSMTGADAVYDAVFRQKGIMRARDVPELLDFSLMAALAPPPAGNRVAILSISGGANVLMADECEEVGLALPALGRDTVAALRRHIPSYGTTHNPVDLTGQFINSPGALPETLGALAADGAVDAVVLFMSVMYPQADVIMAGLTAAHRQSAKPVIAVWTAGPPGALARLRRAGIPAFADPSRAVRALGAYARFAARRRELGLAAVDGR